MILKTNKEIRYDFFTYIINDNAGFVLQVSYFYNLLENNPECILEADIKENKYDGINNWLLCIDSIILKINNIDHWVICAGSISGDLFIWSGKIDDYSRKWIFKDIISKKVSIQSERVNSPKAIFDMDVLGNPLKDNSLRLFYVLNNIHAINRIKTLDNTIEQK